MTTIAASDCIGVAVDLHAGLASDLARRRPHLGAVLARLAPLRYALLAGRLRCPGAPLATWAGGSLDALAVALAGLAGHAGCIGGAAPGRWVLLLTPDDVYALRRNRALKNLLEEGQTR